MAYRCPNSKKIGVGMLKGWRAVFNVHMDIIKTENKNDIVPVVAWDIADEDWAMLDMYEGYPSYYVKEIVNVVLDNGEETEAIVYVMADNRKGICPPASSYFNCIFKGYMDNGIDTDYLFDALDYSIENETEYNQYKIKESV
jgi:cation transport regulator ChaC